MYLPNGKTRGLVPSLFVDELASDKWVVEETGCD